MPDSDVLPTILVVDDDPFTAQLTGFILESAGYVVLIAEGGMDALEKMAETPSIALIVSDMNMPFIDGLQLFAELRSQGDQRPFILLTGDQAEPLRASHPEIDAVITKDDQLQEQLPQLVQTLIRSPHKEN